MSAGSPLPSKAEKHRTVGVAGDREIIITRTTGQPLRFMGRRLGEGVVWSEEDAGPPVATRVRLFGTQGGNYVWAADRFSGASTDFDSAEPEVSDAWPADDNPPRVRRDDPRTVAGHVWLNRPHRNRKLEEASAIAWREAAKRDETIAAGLYEDIA